MTNPDRAMNKTTHSFPTGSQEKPILLMTADSFDPADERKDQSFTSSKYGIILMEVWKRFFVVWAFGRQAPRGLQHKAFDNPGLAGTLLSSVVQSLSVLASQSISPLTRLAVIVTAVERSQPPARPRGMEEVTDTKTKLCPLDLAFSEVSTGGPRFVVRVSGISVPKSFPWNPLRCVHDISSHHLFRGDRQSSAGETGI
ncbi:hypothetical protein RRG08_047403 [Elysia crispata]|uniref:Uncharacterized protein n=1 Tax=Elysia crispata TaxID=231223 RepID=A0AAE0YVW1_9GAST|nr:hypothetical protein RRG08_047403 [Elysia crispata]